MTTVRRVYLYLASFIGMVVTLAGVFVLIGLIVDQGFDAFRGFSISSSAPALALLIAGGAAWRFYWRTVQREANAVLEERASGMRKLYLYGTMTPSLLGALVLAQQVLGEFLVRLFGIGPAGYKPWTPLLIAAVLGLVWRWHKRTADSEQAGGADGARGGDLRRGYWFALTAFGVFGAATGLAAFISGLLSHLGGQTPFGFGVTWMQTLFPPLALLLVSGFAIWMFWLPSQKVAATGDEAERSSRARSWLIHLVVLAATVWALGGAQSVLQDVLSRLLRGSRTDLLVLSINGPLSLLITGGLLLLYFFRQVRSTLPTPRLSEYLIAGVALFIAVFSVQSLVAASFHVLSGQGLPIEELIAGIAPGLIAGGGVWRWRWQGLEAEALGAESGDARSYLWRKVYLYFYQLVGLTMILFGSVSTLQLMISALLGQPFVAPGTNVLPMLATPLAFLLTGSGLMIYKMQVVASDGRLGALSVEDVMRQTLGDAAPTWAIAAAVGGVLFPLFAFAFSTLIGVGSLFNLFR